MSGIRVAFVLRMVDDLTGRPVRGSRFFFTSGGRILRAVRKEEGMYVFLEPQEDAVRLLAEGAGYHRREILVRKNTLDPTDPVVHVRMYGKPDQYRSGGYELLTGRLPDEEGRGPAEILAERLRPVGLTFLKGQQEGGKSLLSFRGFTREDLAGRPYILGGMKEPVPFVLEERRGINVYLADLPRETLQNAQSGAPLIRVYRSVTDAGGAYAMPVEKGEECRLL